jgi:hypothetical protein
MSIRQLGHVYYLGSPSVADVTNKLLNTTMKTFESYLLVFCPLSNFHHFLRSSFISPIGMLFEPDHNYLSNKYLKIIYTLEYFLDYVDFHHFRITVYGVTKFVMNLFL